ncbi:MAG: sulfotransferase family protein [Desulfobacteraceae bacterium]|nr:sulfotransferase family protein [Desulfobacteraceae bacterium]MBC2755335.1 sulfotransferase family protein [Desulfobacteraceae bacterium]
MNKSYITIVSGLPRSGTSMMMQILEAGGIPILTDNIRKLDEDNPKGYYEFEPVKKTKDDPSWVPEAQGKAVKIIYRLIQDLPDGYEYRVLFMQRKMDEVLASQKAMLQRSGKQGATVGDDKLAKLFERQLNEFQAWIRGKQNFSILTINYHDMIHSPQSLCQKVNSFLGEVLDMASAASIVDPTLYRNRT